jgi:hypothetical protein
MRSLMIPSTSRGAGLGLVSALVALVALVSAPVAGATPSIGIYGNQLSSGAARGEIAQFGGGACARGGSSKALRFRVGKRTRECFYLVPVVGRDLEVTATGRLFRNTPKAVRSHAYLGVALRQARNGSRYQLVVYPSGRRWQIRKVLSDGRIQVLKGGRAPGAIKGFSEANRMVLRAYNGVGRLPASTARLVALVNGKRIGAADDVRGGQLAGRDTTFSIGSRKVANGAVGSFVRLRVRIPDPF